MDKVHDFWKASKGSTVTLTVLKNRPITDKFYVKFDLNHYTFDLKNFDLDEGPVNRQLDHTDPFSICMINRKMGAGVTAWFHKGHPDCALPGGRIIMINRARGSWLPVGEQPTVPGYYSLTYQRDGQTLGETLTTGECERLKFKSLDDGLHVYLPAS